VRRFRQGLRLSKRPHHKTLDDYDFSFQPDLDPHKVKDLATLSFVEAKANAALLGPPGVGKTRISALAVAACRAVGYQPLERAEANLVFQVISKRYENGSIILTSNKTFSKAHMFRGTCARRHRNLTGSAWRATSGRGTP
jgi:DNA replication protein DnaC